MNKTNLIAAVAAWIEQDNLNFQHDGDEYFFGQTFTVNGQWGLCLRCQEAPPLLRLACGFPLFVPKKRLAATGQFLHELNQTSILFGAYCLDYKRGWISLQVEVPIGDEDPADQVRTVVALAAEKFDTHFLVLSRFITSEAAPEEAAHWVLEQEEAENAQPPPPVTGSLQTD